MCVRFRELGLHLHFRASSPILAPVHVFGQDHGEISYVKSTKLVPKGTEAKSKKKKSAEKEKRSGWKKLSLMLLEYGGQCLNLGEISGPVATEMGKGTYIHALDNGLFTPELHVKKLMRA